jgi:hypothetical protein
VALHRGSPYWVIGPQSTWTYQVRRNVDSKLFPDQDYTVEPWLEQWMPRNTCVPYLYAPDQSDCLLVEIASTGDDYQRYRVIVPEVPRSITTLEWDLASATLRFKYSDPTNCDWQTISIGVGVSVQSQYRIDTSTLKFQVKNRNITVIEDGGEDAAWTDVHTGTECPETISGGGYTT